MSAFLSRLKALPPVASLRARLGHTGVAARFSSGSFWLTVGLLFWRLPSATTTILIGRILGPTGFGEFGMVNSTVQMMADYGGLGVGPTASRYVAQNRVTDPRKAARVLKLTTMISFVACLLVACLLAFGSQYLATSVLKRPALAVALVVGGVLLLFLVTAKVREYALTGFERFSAVARVNAWRGMATPLVCLPLAYFGWVTGAITGLAVVAGITLALMSVQLRAAIRETGFPTDVSWRESRTEMSVMWTYALPGALTSALMAFAMWYSRLLLVGHPGGYAELGLFEAANQWRMLILFMPDVLARAVGPILAASFGAGADGDFRRTVRLQTLALCSTAAPVCILAIGLSQVVALLFGAGFAAAEPVIAVLVIAVFFYALNQAVRQTYNAVGRRWVNFAMYLLWACTLLGASSILVPRMGATGLAWSMLAAEALLLLVQAAFVELSVFPGAMRPSLGLLAFALAMIGLEYLAWLVLPGHWPLLVAAVLAAATVTPVAHKALRRVPERSP